MKTGYLHHKFNFLSLTLKYDKWQKFLVHLYPLNDTKMLDLMEKAAFTRMEIVKSKNSKQV